jgi:alkanesulfonate monooxygenase SsuD/methylene tetrahydromethanopterin reductase-like flavin-dependent oxidoreductase (luciferase family)
VNLEDPRDIPRAPNPVLNENRMKLGVFGYNSHGTALTWAPEAFTVTWPQTLEVARRADAMGLEAIVPYARWKGFLEDDVEQRANRVLECFTWAAGLAASTQYSAIFSTSHVPTIHPVLAAKQCVTIDHISGGRFGLNVVAGWHGPELEMFGLQIKEHDTRYEQASEWLDIMRRLWSEYEEFDYEGEFYDVKKAVSRPKPLQAGGPTIMNAGGSDRGRLFAAKYADLAFVILQSEEPDEVRAAVAEYRDCARAEFGRDLQVWTYGYVVQRDTAADADAYESYYVDEHGDIAHAEAFIEGQIASAQVMPEELWNELRRRIIAGNGGVRLVGTADMIADKLAMLADAGISGVLLNWVEPIDGLDRWGADVLPRLEAAGLRKPHEPPVP